MTAPLSNHDMSRNDRAERRAVADIPAGIVLPCEPDLLDETFAVFGHLGLKHLPPARDPEFIIVPPTRTTPLPSRSARTEYPRGTPPEQSKAMTKIAQPMLFPTSGAPGMTAGAPRHAPSPSSGEAL